MIKEVIKCGGRSHGKSIMAMQARLTYCVNMVSPKPLMLHKSQYEHFEGLGLDMTGCKVIEYLTER